MATITPVVTTEQNNRDAQYDRIRKFNPTIQSIGKELACPVADQFKAISSVPGWPSNLIERVSGNHPNDAGYQRVRDAFYNTLSAELLSGSVY